MAALVELLAPHNNLRRERLRYEAKDRVAYTRIKAKAKILTAVIIANQDQ